LNTALDGYIGASPIPNKKRTKGYALMQVPSGMLAEKFGPRKMISIALLWWSAFTIELNTALDGYIGASPIPNKKRTKYNKP
jgi:hypothetical protein